MATLLLDRIGLGNARAVANARHEALRPEREDRIIADLIESLARHEPPRSSLARRGTDAPPPASREAAA